MVSNTSYLLTVARASQAIDIVRPAIEAAMKSGRMKRNDLHIVIMDPCARPDVKKAERAILYKASFGDPAAWENDYEKIAEAKAFASWRTGLPTHVLRETMPHLLMTGDTAYWGSAVLNGVVVAASGVQPWYDEMVSYMVAAACRALCIGKMQEEILPTGRAFF